MKVKKSVFEYDDYRAFLRDAYAGLKQEDKRFSLRYFSKVAGFKSHSVLKQVMEGKINIASSSIEKFAKAFKLNKEETTFFRHLVLLNQSSSVEEKQEHLKELIRCRAFRKLFPLGPTHLNSMQNWYYIPLRELVNLVGFNENPDWIAKKLSPRITPQEAKRALDDLIQLGLLKRNEEGRLVQSDANISSGNEVTSQALASLHKELIKKGAESIDRYPRELRDISSVTLGVSNEAIKMIKEKVQKFRKELLEEAGKIAGPNIVYQLNFQIFPLTEETDEDVK